MPQRCVHNSVLAPNCSQQPDGTQWWVDRCLSEQMGFARGKTQILSWVLLTTPSPGGRTGNPEKSEPGGTRIQLPQPSSGAPWLTSPPRCDPGRKSVNVLKTSKARWVYWRKTSQLHGAVLLLVLPASPIWLLLLLNVAMSQVGTAASSLVFSLPNTTGSVLKGFTSL